MMQTDHANDVTIHGYPPTDSPCQAVDPFGDPTVETVYTFGRKQTAGDFAARMRSGPLKLFPLVKRQDRHDDGSITTTYYLELVEAQYKALGGE